MATCKVTKALEKEEYIEVKTLWAGKPNNSLCNDSPKGRLTWGKHLKGCSLDYVIFLCVRAQNFAPPGQVVPVF